MTQPARAGEACGRSPTVGDAPSPPQRSAFGHVMAADYEFRIKGRLSDTLCGVFEEFTAAVQPAETVMRGQVRDQAELHGLLGRIQPAVRPARQAACHPLARRSPR